MASYISSNANRFYTALESAYGQVEAITAANRIPAVKLAIRQQVRRRTRRDKTGSRTFAGLPAGRQAAHGLRAADVPDELGQDRRRARDTVRCFEAALGGDAAAVRGRNGGVEHGGRAARIRSAARTEAGPGGVLRRRDPLRGGDRGCADGAIECAVH